MLKLTTATTKLQLVIAGATVAVDVTSSMVDRNTVTGAITSGEGGQNIVGAGTTDIVAAPAANVERAIEQLDIFNTHGTATVTATIQRTDGVTTTVLWKGDLPPGGLVFLVPYGTVGTDRVTGVFLSTAPLTSSGKNLQSFETVGKFTWTKPTSFAPQWVIVWMWGGGGGGGSGASNATGATARMGGCGGGGGAYTWKRFRAADLGATESVVVGYGGLGGVNTGVGAGTEGAVGGTSSFGTNACLIACGGGGGRRGNNSSQAGAGGGGGGAGTPGGVGGTTQGLGGEPSQQQIDSFGGAGAQTTTATAATAAGYAEFGGGAGATHSTTVNGNGGTSIYGAGGGGHGGTASTGPILVNATDGGASCACVTLGGGGGAAGASGAGPANGTPGAAGNGRCGGAGGGGGGGSITANTLGKNGALGGAPGGGGGGGGCGTDLQGGDGGNGAIGAVYVASY